MSTGSTAGQRLHLRLFLEGIEVPVVGAQVQSNVNAPATASIQVVPLDSILNLKARTLVHLFYWDGNLDLPDADPTERDPLDGYKMLFGGEVIGLAYHKTPSGRSAVLQCADWSTYWDTTYQIYITTGKNGNFLADSSAVWAGSNSLFNDLVDSHALIMTEQLQRKSPRSEGLKDVKGLMAGIISLLEVMGGVPNKLRGVNDFFTIAELRLHILQQITAEQDDDTAQRLFNRKEFNQWLNNGASSMGELVTFRDMLKLLFQWVYYEVVPVTCPKYDAGEKTQAVDKTLPPNFPPSVKAKLQELLALSSTRAGESETSDVTQTTSAPSTVIDSNNPQRLAAGDFKKQLDTISKVKGLLKAVRELVERASIYANDIMRADRSMSTAQFRRLWRLISNVIGEAIEVGSGQGRVTSGKKTERKRPKVDQLHTQIFRPDCFFVAPPRCNVVFPEQYTQFSYSRNFLQEATRLRLSVGLSLLGEGAAPDALFGSFYYAPALTEIKKIAKDQGNSGLRALLPWEIHSGIMPKFEHIAEADYIANKRERELRGKVKTGSAKASAYSQRAANFNYLKYRFAARSLDINARFSPQVVCGFPGAVIERPFTLDPSAISEKIAAAGISNISQATVDDVVGNIDLLAEKFRAPTQYLGMIAAVAHTVDQSGGSTVISMSHARSHRLTEDEFLVAYSAEITKDASKRVVTTVLDAEKLIKDGDYRLLRFLKDATPQNVPEQNELARRQREEEQAGSSPQDITPSSRPTGAPNLAQVDALIPIVFSASSDEGEPIVVSSQEEIVSEDGETVQVPLQGGTQEAALLGTTTKIIEPHPYSKSLCKGSKGPQGGKVKQIQLFSKQVVKIPAHEFNRLLKNKDRKKENQRQQGKNFIYLWAKAAIHEEIQGRPLSKPVALEESIRPPWFSPLYSNFYIGKKIYEPFFGCGSVVDEAVFSTAQGRAIAIDNRKKAHDLEAQLQAAEGDAKKQAQLIEKFKGERLSDIPSVESGLDVLAYLYGEVRRQGLDVHQFVANYTERPVATMRQILGSDDLVYEKDSSGKKLKIVGNGTPGFHSTAVLQQPLGKDLLGLLDNPDNPPLPRLRDKGKKASVDRSLDPRPTRQAAVLDYARSLQEATGSLGVGLLG